ncbi:hypothetical protein V8C34DRAFT_283400 [Trichoderma compactum]
MLLSKLVLVITSSLVLFLFHPASSLAHIAGKRPMQPKLLIDRPPLKNAIDDGSRVCAAQVLRTGTRNQWRGLACSSDDPSMRQASGETASPCLRSDLAIHGQPRQRHAAIPLGIGQWQRIGHAAVAAGKEEHIHLSYVYTWSSLVQLLLSAFCFLLSAFSLCRHQAGHEPALLAVVIRDSGLRPVLSQDASYPQCGA